MKIPSKVLILLSISAFGVMGQREILALKNSQKSSAIDTCSQMQEAANAVKWRYKTIFHGFENLPMNTNATTIYAGRDRLCQLGYITRFTPMGKEVCQGSLYTRNDTTKIWWNYGYYRPNLYSPVNNKSDFCRYTN
jgi:hypothetical protein